MNLPSGLYEKIVDQELHKLLASLEDVISTDLAELDPGESHSILAQHLYSLLKSGLNSFKGQERIERQVQLCNSVASLIAQVTDDSEWEVKGVAEPARQLLTLLQRDPAVATVPRPDTPLALGCLLTGTKLDPSLVSQLRAEFMSADRVDVLCSFIKWSGVRILEEQLKIFTGRPETQLRVITTSYMGATDLKAIEFLDELPKTQLKVSYDTHRTRLHAKAYLFHRKTGFGTAYIGSANLSHAALTEGLEWNIKVSQYEQPHVWDKVTGTFETYWNDVEFCDYSASEKEFLRQALNAERSGNSEDAPQFHFDLRPYAFQQEILERLQAEREFQKRSRHLVVAATGTGKTMIAAFDYKAWRKDRQIKGESSKLLFVAHREEILTQSLHAFRGVLKDQNFGDLMVGGRRPDNLDHLFVSIQTYNSQNLASQFTPDHFEFVVIDEFHHAAAPSYQNLLETVSPQILMGLTATPERSDQLDIRKYFDQHISAEIRLPDAISRKLLSPFQYFCITDSVDLEGLMWQRGGYRATDLNKIYTGNDARADLIMQKVCELVLDVRSVKGLAFCVSVEHAVYMAEKFNQGGIPSECLHGSSPREVRDSVQQRLRHQEINFIFVVDLYNEGIDIPEADTILFLRPTESLTVFLQQLGRGLRLSDAKECLTVLDFIGQAHRNYRFDLKFRALLTDRANPIERELSSGFPHLPAGCTIQMERVARQHVLANIRHSILMARPLIVRRISTFESDIGRPLAMPQFLEYYGMELDDIYRRKATWARLCVEADKRPEFNNPDEPQLTKGLRRLAHIDDPKQIEQIKNLLASDQSLHSELLSEEIARRFVRMLHFSLWGREWLPENEFEVLERLGRNPEIKAELLELLEYRLASVASVAPDIQLPFLCPLHLHSQYTRDEMLAALGHWSFEQQPELREGVLHLREISADVFMVTLNKTEKDYSPSTMYEDYAISERLFHWQTQSTTSESSPTGQRYIEHKERRHTILLFVRENKRKNGLASPYYFLGPAEYAGHQGGKPMNITWKLAFPLPAHLLRRTARMSTS